MASVRRYDIEREKDMASPESKNVLSWGIILGNAASLATILAAVAAIAAFWYGYKQFYETQESTRRTLLLQKEALEMERESQAIELNIKYNELMAGASPQDVASVRLWRDNLSVGIAESIFRLRRGDEGWEKTASWILSNHTGYLKQGFLDCDTFDKDFVRLMNGVAKQNVCQLK